MCYIRSAISLCTTVLQEILDLGLAHHAKLDEVETAASRSLPEDGIRIACYLGNIDPDDSTKMQESLLRVELADKLLRKNKPPRNKDDEILQSIKPMLVVWRNCELEDVRIRGIRLSKNLKM